MILLGFFYLLYMISLFMLILNNRAVCRVFYIVLSSFSACGMLYEFRGFRWYLMLFVLIYVGGVYVLFIYVRFEVPKIGLSGDWPGSIFFYFLLFSLCGVIFSSRVSWDGWVMDYRDYLCYNLEGISYTYFRVLLLLGISLINCVKSGGDGYYR